MEEEVAECQGHTNVDLSTAGDTETGSFAFHISYCILSRLASAAHHSIRWKMSLWSS